MFSQIGLAALAVAVQSSEANDSIPLELSTDDTEPVTYAAPIAAPTKTIAEPATAAATRPAAVIPAKKTENPLAGPVSLVRTITAIGAIGLILLQNPQSQEASSAMAGSNMFGSVKQSANFLNILTWFVIFTFIGTSAFLATL
ncbi:hypothetical protein CYMTET_19695 [Cymbomonas tetramitiformis]|uniref:Probable protein-export membrane protein SecG n=1 Tax=Cymbomonas tetramitiformis TaxID=36881 RepID=A0AAE0L4Z2_9CHLO|nr:hypothetical protein CYMTET_19695 [Cymbomonas tetramitiformis]